MPFEIPLKSGRLLVLKLTKFEKLVLICQAPEKYVISWQSWIWKCRSWCLLTALHSPRYWFIDSSVIQMELTSMWCTQFNSAVIITNLRSTIIKNLNIMQSLSFFCLFLVYIFELPLRFANSSINGTFFAWFSAFLLLQFKRRGLHTLQIAEWSPNKRKTIPKIASNLDLGIISFISLGNHSAICCSIKLTILAKKVRTRVLNVRVKHTHKKELWLRNYPMKLSHPYSLRRQWHRWNSLAHASTTVLPPPFCL